MKSPRCYPKHCCQLNIPFSLALHSLLATPALFSIKGLSHYSSAYKTLPFHDTNPSNSAPCHLLLVTFTSNPERV